MISCKFKRHQKESYRFSSLKIYGNLRGGFNEFPHLEIVNLRIPPKFPALETLGKPHRWFPRVSTPGNSQPEDSISSLHWKLLGNLISGFHEFSHLGTVNPRIPHRFPALRTLGKPHRWFPRDSTPGNSQPEDST